MNSVSSATTSQRSEVAFAWYFHLPLLVTSPVEVSDHVDGSLLPLLRVHKIESCPLLLALTGSFVQLLTLHRPDALDRIQESIASENVCLGATCFHEINPFAVSWRLASLHVARDVELKRKVFDLTPAVYFPPNYAWRAGFEQVLANLGIDTVLLDCRHLKKGVGVQAWNWNHESKAQGTIVSEYTNLRTWEYRRIRKVDGLQGASFNAYFRDWPSVKSLTFGNNSLIHRIDGTEEIAGLVSSWSKPTELVVLADDGDRIRGRSLRNYRGLVHECQDRALDWNDAALKHDSLPPVRSLPSFNLRPLDFHLSHSTDARSYLGILDEIEASPISDNELEEFMSLQDVFYPFWGGTSRRDRYLEVALDLYARTVSMGGHI